MTIEQRQWTSLCDCAECRRVTGRPPRTEPQSLHVRIYKWNGVVFDEVERGQ